MPEFGEQFHLQHGAQIFDTTRAAGAAFKADYAFDRGNVVEAPAAEIIFQIDEFFRELIQAPVFFRRAIDNRPRIRNRRIGLVWRILV